MSMIGFTKYVILYIGGVIITILTIIGLIFSIRNKVKNNNRSNNIGNREESILPDVAEGILEGFDII